MTMALVAGNHFSGGVDPEVPRMFLTVLQEQAGCAIDFDRTPVGYPGKRRVLFLRNFTKR